MLRFIYFGYRTLELGMMSKNEGLHTIFFWLHVQQLFNVQTGSKIQLKEKDAIAYYDNLIQCFFLTRFF